MRDPLGRPIRATYARDARRRLAVIEMAAASGLPLLARHERDPRRVNFSVIKCYMLHVYEHPEQHEEEDIRQKTRLRVGDSRVLKIVSPAETT